jgi:hypothetical protein
MQLEFASQPLKSVNIDTLQDSQENLINMGKSLEACDVAVEKPWNCESLGKIPAVGF